MSDTSPNPVGRAFASSAIVRLVRQVVAGSALVAVGRSVNEKVQRFRHRLQRGRERVVAGLGGGWSSEREMRASRHMVELATNSRMTALWSVVGAPAADRGNARLTRLLQPILSLDLSAQVRVAGGVIIVAVLTHTVLLAALRADTQRAGWLIRAALVVTSVLVMVLPRALAAAWKDRKDRRER